jgi:hypothetical protein
MIMKEAVLLCFKMPFLHLPEKTGENYQNLGYVTCLYDSFMLVC